LRATPIPALVRAIALAAAALTAVAYTPPPTFRKDINPQSAETCRSCHIDISDQWNRSAHARADRTKDELFGRMYFYSLRETRGATMTKCGPCHETMSFVQNDFDIPRQHDVNSEGVTCTFCHAIDAKGPANAVPPFELDLGAYYGPIRDPITTQAHKSRFSSLYSSSDYCGGCHKYSNEYGVPISDTIGEWKKTKYAKEGVTCQTCHMPGHAGRVTSSGPVRRRVTDHSFTDDPAQNPRLRNAITLKLLPQRLGKDSLRVVAVVTNARAGHSMPTGNDQKMLLIRLRVLTTSGTIVWENDPFQEWQQSIFGLLLADELRHWPAETWNAREIVSDRRIPAGESGRAVYEIPLRDTAGPFQVTAQVLFRTGRPSTLQAYGLNEDLWGAEHLMAEATARVP
jgi:nitrate/TMAO reductase-like tetraheme cytochrome c subunit